MSILEWAPGDDPTAQLKRWCELAASPGVLRVVFADSHAAEGISWRVIDRWTRSRAVTVAEIRTSLAPPALDVALCADLVYLQEDASLVTGDGEATAGLVWALGRSGSRGLARGLLDTEPISSSEARQLGLVHGVFEAGQSIELPEQGSEVALTIARDLMRSTNRSGQNLQLELAAFRLLFASKDPREGARAFLERRPPDFGDSNGRSGDEVAAPADSEHDG
jgi:enoyl-CoA hydratase/carnithine racemase